MSKPRTIQEINNEYYQAAAMMGDLIHKTAKFTGELPYEGQIGEYHRKLLLIDKEADLYQKSEERKRSNDIQKASETKKAGTNGATLVPQNPKTEETTTTETQVQ